MTLVWLIPTLALAAFAAEKVFRGSNALPAAKPELMKIPVEVIQGDDKAKIVYVELQAQSVPEPSSLLFLPVSLLPLLRRRR